MAKRSEKLRVTNLREKIQFLIYGQSGPVDDDRVTNYLVEHFKQDDIRGIEFLFGRNVAPIVVTSWRMLCHLIGVRSTTGGAWFRPVKSHGRQYNLIPRNAAEKIACLFQFDLEWEEWQTGTVRDFAVKYDFEHQQRLSQPTAKPMGPTCHEANPWPGSLALGDAILSFGPAIPTGVSIGAHVRGYVVRGEIAGKYADLRIGFSRAFLDVLVTPRNAAVAMRDCLPARLPDEVQVNVHHRVDDDLNKVIAYEFDAGKEPIAECKLQSIALLEGLAEGNVVIGMLIVPANKFVLAHDRSSPDLAGPKVVRLPDRQVRAILDDFRFTQQEGLPPLPSVWAARLNQVAEKRRIFDNIAAKLEEESDDAASYAQTSEGVSEEDRELSEHHAKNKDGYYIISWHTLRIEGRSQ